MAGPAKVDLTGKVAFVAGVADSSGYGWAIARALASAGATIIHPPDGSKMVIEKVYPLDAVFDCPADVPAEIKDNKRYAGLDGYTIEEVAAAVKADYGKIDILVIPGYGGGMSSAKAQLELDGEVERTRQHHLSAGPLKSRAASAIGKEPGQKTFAEYAIDYSNANAPLAQDLYNDDVGNLGVVPLLGLGGRGLHAMGMALDSRRCPVA
ncbi:hypothetical protein ACHAW5_001570 [Stephanodiscus triporus]|uniref:Uncharacterized protein n=1 Tax=Stephanodiscus triporus TaxID=2934178 RepID=A0ABD3NLT7_9STRA